MMLLPCPACGSTDIDPAGVTLGPTTGPACRDCGLWAARTDWSPAQNKAGWNALEREEA